MLLDTAAALKPRLPMKSVLTSAAHRINHD
jgi:hypothetical protein